MRPHSSLIAAACLAFATSGAFAQNPPATKGVRDVAWAPSGTRIAVSYLDRIWTMTPDGKDAKALTTGQAVEREPAWSSDGKRIAYAADTGDGFDIYVVPAAGGTPVRVTSLSGDERSPSWTPDGRIVYASRAGTGPTAQWDLALVAESGGTWQAPQALTTTPDNESGPRVAPDGKRVVFVSNRQSEDDTDLWLLPLPAPGTAFTPLGGRGSTGLSRGGMGPSSAVAPPAGVMGDSTRARRSALRAVRLTNDRGLEAYASWSPRGDRIAYYAERENVGSVWVLPVDQAPPADTTQPVPHARPEAPAQLVSRRGGQPAWSPDGKTLLVTGLPAPEPGYNGNPLRNTTEPPPLFEGDLAYQLWRVPAPLPVDEGGGMVHATLAASRAALTAAFDRVWSTLRDLYYKTGDAAPRWTALRDKYRPQAAAAGDTHALEAVVDRMVAEQPLIKPVVTSSRAVVVSGHPLASEAGRLALEKGGNVVDAAIAVSFALGVVSPEATSVGGDGMAVLYLKGMTKPTVIDYKDETPGHATADNPAIMRDGRIVGDGPAAANLPGTVAGLEYMYRHYASGKVSWADLIAPAIQYADSGWILNEALPTSIAEGRQYLEKYPEAAKIFLPGGKVPAPGDRFYNHDYANTLRAIAQGGAAAFYRGSIAHKIVADMEANGGIITLSDLAQYRAIEREPVTGHYRGHTLYAPGPPLSTGIGLFETLHILEHYTPTAGARASTDADYFHYLIEAWKVRDPLRRVADPERWSVDYAEHLEPAHALELFKTIDPSRASYYHRTPPDAEPEGAPTTTGPHIGTGTTAFVVADAEGNMIAITQTLSTWGGTFYVSKGLGFLYNNHLRANRPGTGYGSMLPLMRSSSTSVPTLVFADGANGPVPQLAVGAAGNAWITAAVYSVITGVIDGGMGAQQAVESPRFLVGRDPGDSLSREERVQIEDRFPIGELDNLITRGHRFQKIGRKGEVMYGYASAALVDVLAHKVEGGAEPRRSHAAIAY